MSKIIAWSLRAFSKEVRFRMRNPCRAASAVETATTNGIASPRAWGQVITITVTLRSRENAKVSEAKTNHTIRVITPAESPMMVSHFAARSARFWVLDRAVCADRTSSITCEMYRALPGTGHPDYDRSIPVDRSPDDLISCALVDRYRLSCDHRFVHAGLSGDHFTIDRDPFTGFHPNRLAGPDLLKRDFYLGSVLLHQVSLRGEKSGKLLERP